MYRVACIYVCVCVCIPAYVYVICKYIYIYIYICVCVYICFVSSRSATPPTVPYVPAVCSSGSTLCPQQGALGVPCRIAGGAVPSMQVNDKFTFPRESFGLSGFHA